MSAAIRNPLSTAELAMVHAVHRAADAITRLIDDPATRPASLQAVEYLEGGRRRLRRISDDIDKVLQQFRDAQQSSAPPASPERVTLPGKRPAEVGGADLDAEFEAALLDGELCEGCGVYIGPGQGYPRKCRECRRERYLDAARCPLSLAPQSFGLWTIDRRMAPLDESARRNFISICGGLQQTALCRITDATMHMPPGEVVMEDSILELRRHLPIWLHAKGRVLVTGLGLGCVVRGLLASSDVEHIDVIEIDRGILERVGAEFLGNSRVTLHHGNALTCKMPAPRWHYGWHDLWCEGSGLQLLHLRLIERFRKRCANQGAWMLPRIAKRRITSLNLIG